MKPGGENGVVATNSQLREQAGCRTFVAVKQYLKLCGTGGRGWLKVAILSLLLVLLPGLVNAGPGDEALPTDHWANDVIYELYAAGVWGRWPIGTKPWFRGDIVRRLEEIAGRQKSDPASIQSEHRWLLATLRSEFDDLLNPRELSGELVLRNGGDLFGSSITEEHRDGILRGRITSYAGVGTGIWWAYVRGDIDSHGDNDPTFFGRRWKDHLTGTIDRGLISWRRNSLTVSAGREVMAWGSGSHDLLLMNDQSPPFDLVRFSYHHKYFDFSYFLTGLDSDFGHPDDTTYLDAENIKRYFAGHRLEFRPASGLQIGLSEVVVWGGPGRQLEAFYLNPFLPYYWEQLNANVDDNPLWSVDMSYIIPRGPMVYGELLVDDFQIDFSSESQQLGWMLGLNWARPVGLSGSFFTFDWSHIEPTVYGQNRPYNRYLNHRIGMGSDMGPDADRLFARFRQHISAPVQISIKGMRTRKGEQEIATPQLVAVSQTEFPTGIVETHLSGSLSLLYRPDAHFEFTLGGGYRSTTNADHIDGTDHKGAFVQFSLRFSGWRTHSL